MTETTQRWRLKRDTHRARAADFRPGDFGVELIARVWAVAQACDGPVRIATVRQHLPEARPGSIKNALDRLHSRGALIRTASGRAYVYRVAP